MKQPHTKRQPLLQSVADFTFQFKLFSFSPKMGTEGTGTCWELDEMLRVANGK